MVGSAAVPVRGASVGDVAVNVDRKPVRRTLPEKLEHLFATVRPPGGMGREYTHQEIAQLASAAGASISASYVWVLRTNPAKNPTMRSLEALAKAFDVPVAYFFNDESAAQIEENLDLIGALRSRRVRGVALAASGLSRESLESIMQMIERAREWEGLGEWDGLAEAPPDPAP